MFCAYTKIRYQVTVYRTIGPLITIHGRGGHQGHVTQMPLSNFRGGSTQRLALIGQAVLV